MGRRAVGEDVPTGSPMGARRPPEPWFSSSFSSLFTGMCCSWFSLFDILMYGLVYGLFGVVAVVADRVELQVPD